MFSIAPPSEPRWLDLPHGVRVEVRPADGMTIAAAEYASVRAAQKLEAERAEALADGADVSGMRDLGDPDLRQTFVRMTFAAKLAAFGIMRWEGVAQDHTPALAEALMMRHLDMATAFLGAYLAPAEALAAEGNASAPAPNGSSAGAQDIAEAARPDALPVPAT